jgi:hypothetical protein
MVAMSQELLHGPETPLQLDLLVVVLVMPTL